MAIDFPAYTLEELETRARALVRYLQFNDRGVRDADVGVGSDYDIKARLIARIAHGMQEFGRSALRALDPLQSFGDFARQFASIHGIGGVLDETDYVAVKAKGFAIARSTTASQSITSGTVLQHPDGTQYTVDTTGSTSSTATKTFSTGHRSRKNWIFQGQTTSAPAAGEIYEAASGELCAVRDADDASVTAYRWVQLQDELDALPAQGDVFTQRFGRVVPITAVLAGRLGNKERKDVLTFVSPPGTVQAQARIIRLTGGRDTLLTSQIQQGIRDLYGTRLATLTLADVLALVLATPDISTRSAVVFPGLGFPGNQGAGTYYAILTGQDWCIASGADRAAVTAYAARFVPPPDRVLAYESLPVRALLIAYIKVAPEFAPDWTVPSGFSVTSTTVTATRITFTTSIPAGTFETGDRIITCIGRGTLNSQDVCLLHRRITAIGSNYVDIDPPLPYVPTVAEVSPSGPYGDDLIAAIESYFDNQMPFSTAHMYPAVERPPALETIRAELMRVPGILDCVLDEALGASLSETDVFGLASFAMRVYT